MTYYWILLFIILLLCESGAKTPNRNKVLLVCLFLFFVFFAFRIGFTPDYKNYEDAFQYLHNGRIDSEIKTEIGYQWLCKLMPSNRAVLIVYTLLFCYCIYIAFRVFIRPKYWVMAMAILFLYEPFVLGNMAGMRSGFVTCFFFLAIVTKIKYKKMGLLMALGLMVIAVMFHRTAVAIAPLVLIPGKPFNKYVNYFIYLLAAVGIYAGIKYANEINMLALSFAVDVFERGEYKAYFEDDINVVYNIMMLFKTTITIVLMYLTLKFSNEEQDVSKSLFLKYTTFLYILMLIPISNVVGRFLYYFAFPCVIATPIVYAKAKKEMKIIYMTCLALIIIMDLRYFYRSESFLYYQQYSNILFSF